MQTILCIYARGCGKTTIAANLAPGTPTKQKVALMDP